MNENTVTLEFDDTQLDYLRKELCRVFQIPEKILFGNEKEKEKDMGRNATTQCENCSHNQVCKYRPSLAKASIAANEAIDRLTAEDDPNTNGIDLSFIYPIEVKCKYRYSDVESAITMRDYARTTQSDAIPHTYTDVTG